MDIVVVYESLFGNTKTIAEAIAEGLREAGPVTIGDVDTIDPDAARSARMVVAGGPTHAHGMVRAMSRHPKGKYPPVLPGTRILSEWISSLGLSPGLAAAFDTRFDKPKWITGAASKKIVRLLAKQGRSAFGAESFLVSGTAGPLLVGERERAVSWGRSLAMLLAEREPAHRFAS